MATRILAWPCIALAVAACTNERPTVVLNRPDGTKVTCTQPPPDVMNSQVAASIDAQLPKLQNAIKADATLDQKFERIRAETPNIQAVEILEYRYCEAYGNGIFASGQYDEAVGKIIPLLFQSVSSTAASPSTSPPPSSASAPSSPKGSSSAPAPTTPATPPSR